MKTLYLFFTLQIISQLGFAQDWLPIADTSYSYIYLDCEKDQLYWLYADSLINDTFYINKILVDVDSLMPSEIAYCKFFDDTAPIKVQMVDQPNFLEYQIINRKNGMYQLLDPGNRVIFGQAKVGDSWLFDSISNVYAGVISAQQQQIWEQKDSVKTIILSTGDSILISKNHGILKYPKTYSQACYYTLLGIEGQGVGRIMPKAIDFYNFNIGDKFEFYDTNDYLNEESTIQYEIIGEQVFEDNILTYEVKGFWKTHPFYANDEPTYGKLSTVGFRFDDSKFTFNNKVFKTLASGYLNSSPFWIHQLNDCYATYNNYKIDTDGVISIDVGLFTSFISRDTFSSPYAVFYQDGLQFGYNPHFDFVIGKRFIEGLGSVESISSGQYPNTSKLVAYRKNGVTVGTFTPEPIIHPNDDCVGLRIKSIFPNPVRDKLNITLNQNSDVFFELWDLQGRQLFATQLYPTQDSIFLHDNTLKCDVFQASVTIPASVSPGLYILRVSSDEGIETKKIFISK